jgi:hypothetical protein
MTPVLGDQSHRRHADEDFGVKAFSPRERGDILGNDAIASEIRGVG